MSSQTIMYILLGFSVASLIAIFLSKIIYYYAYKAATKQFRGQIPLNKAELEAERDRLRSEHAVNITKLEHKIAASLQSELQYRVQLNKKKEQSLQIEQLLNSYIKKAVRWEAAHDNVNQILKLTQNKLAIQTKNLDDMLERIAQVEILEKRHNDARLTYELADAKYIKIRNDRDETNRQIKTIQWEMDKIQQQHEATKAKLKQAESQNINYETKITELSTEALFLGQQLHAKKIKLDMSTKAIDRYKEKLLKQKLLDRNTPLGKKAIAAIKGKILTTNNHKTKAEAQTPEKSQKQPFSSINADLINPSKTDNLIKFDTLPPNVDTPVNGTFLQANKPQNIIKTEVTKNNLAQDIMPTAKPASRLKDRMQAANNLNA